MSTWTFETTPDEIGLLHIDVPDKKVNVLSSSVMAELSDLLNILSQKPLQALVISSGKPNQFIAGADITEIQSIRTHEEGQFKSSMGQTIFNQLAELPYPTVAVIDGPCLGGGLELALACTYRIVSDGPKVQLGLPEVNLGILPGFGGTQRLPKLIGFQAALELILTGQAINAKKALRLHLADALYPQGFLADLTRKFIQHIHSETGRKKVLASRHARPISTRFLESNPAGREIVSRIAHQQVRQKTQGHYPAPLKALAVVKSTYGIPLQKGLAVEAKAFADLVISKICQNLTHLFFVQEQLKKPSHVSPKPWPLTHSAVLGAGLMGGGIAWALSNAELDVRLKDLNWENVGRGLAAAENLYQKGVERKKLSPPEALLKFNHISGTLDYSGFGLADIVIEAIVENMAVKKGTLAELEQVVRPDTIIASNTSSLSITEMAAALNRPERFVGMHFFSPVHRMPLVEVIPGDKTDPGVVEATMQLARQMKKTPIRVKNVPGFLVNRILIPYVNEAVHLLEEGVDMLTLDRLMTQFGMPIGPLALADEVGLDVGYKVAVSLESGYGQRMAVPAILTHLHENKDWLGKKSGKGFYVHGHGTKVPNSELLKAVSDWQKAHRRESGTRPSMDDCLDRMVLIMVNEAARCLAEHVVAGPAELDMAMIMGTGFPPFRGGLCRYADQTSMTIITERLQKLSERYGRRFEPASLLVEMAENNHTFFKEPL